MQIQNQIPLVDKQAEISVLGSMIMDHDAATIAVNILQKDDFANPANAKVFETLKNMYTSNIEIDLVTLKFELEKQCCFEAVGGVNYIGYIINFVPTSAHIKRYCKQVQELSIRRKYLTGIEDIKKQVHTGSYIDLLEATKKLNSFQLKTNDIVPLTDILDTALKKVKERMQSGSKLTGLPTGFEDLDILTGGLQNTDYIVIAGRPSMGKTAFALDILRNSAPYLIQQNKIAVVSSLEMSTEKLVMRLLSAETQINNQSFRLGLLNKINIKTLDEKMEYFRKIISNIYIDDTSFQTVQDIYSKCYTQKCNTGKQIGLIVIDYLQLISSNNSKYNNRNNEVAEISKTLKGLAKDFNCPILVLSQLNRATETRADKRPILADLRESGAIEQDADVVLMVHREDYYNHELNNHKAEIIIAKNRDGDTGTIGLTFLKEITSFRNNLKVGDNIWQEIC